MVIGSVLIFRQNSLGYLIYYFVKNIEGNIGNNGQVDSSNIHAINSILFK